MRVNVLESRGEKAESDSRSQVDVFHVGFADGRSRGVRLKSQPEEGEPQIFPVSFLQRSRVRHVCEETDRALSTGCRR